MGAVFASDVDAVLIASSTPTHTDFVERAARAGKAIYGEKPIDLDTDRTGRAVATLRMASGALVQIDSTRRTRYGDDERVEVFGSEGMGESRRQPYRHLSVLKRRKRVSDGLNGDWLERIEPTFAAALDAFVGGLHGEGVDYPGLEAALRAQRIADAAARSLESLGPVRIAH